MYLIYRASLSLSEMAVRFIIGQKNLLGVFERHVITTFAPYQTFLWPNVKSILTSVSTMNISNIHYFLPDIFLITITFDRKYTCLLRLSFLFDLLQ